MVLRNNFIVVILGGCLYLTAQARVPQAKLPTLPVLQAHYQSLYKILNTKSVWSDKAIERAAEEGLDLIGLRSSLKGFLKGNPLDEDIFKELKQYGAEYEGLLNAKAKGHEIRIADLLQYSEEIAKAHEQKYEEGIRLVDESIKSLPSKNKLYLFTIELTLENGEKVTLIKPGKSSAGNINKRIKEQLSLLKGIANHLEEVTFTLPQFGTLAVEKMEVEQVNLAGKEKYLDLNYGVTDGDVHKHLSEFSYQMVHGIPNIQGGEKREVFIRIEDGKYKDSNYVEEVVEAWKKVQGEKTYYDRIQNNIPIPSNTGISLNLGEYRTQLIFEQMKLSASEFKDDKAKLASMLFDIKRYKERTGNGEKLQGLYDAYVKKNGYDKDIQAAAEVLSEELFLIYRIISTIKQEERGTVSEVARRLGLGQDYSYKKHLEEGFSSFISEYDDLSDEEKENIVLRNLTTLGIVLHTRHAELTGVYKDFLELYPEVSNAFGILQASIKDAGGWQALQAAIDVAIEKARQNDESTKAAARAAGQFRNELAKAALRGEDIERITEVILIYRIISTIQQEERGTVSEVAKRLGLGRGYSYKMHLEEGLSSFIRNKDELDSNQQKKTVLINLTTLGILLRAQYAKLIGVYDKLLELHPEVKTAFDLLKASIKAAGGWKALHTVMQKNNPTRAGRFRNELAKAALRGTDEERITEVILIYRIISTIQQKEKGVGVDEVARRMGLGNKYNYNKHLEEGLAAASLMSMDITIANNYSDDAGLRNLFDQVLNLQGEKEKVITARQLLQASIKDAGGWQALQAAMQKNGPSAAGHFRNQIAKAALRGEDIERIIEVVLIYRIISTIQQEGEEVHVVAKRMGLGQNYSYKKHLEKGLTDASLLFMIVTIANNYSDNENLSNLFDKILNLRNEKEKRKIITARQLLQTSIDTAGSWQALQAAMQTGDVGQFRNQLAEAALRGEDKKRITEVVLIYRIISTIRKKGESVMAVASRMSLGLGYSYDKHLEEGLISFIRNKDELDSNQQKKAVLINLTTLGIVLYTQYAKLTGVYDKLLDLHYEVSTAFDLLQTSIAKAGGWQALHTAMNTSIETDKQKGKSTRGAAVAAGQFRNELAKAALGGEDIERITEVILLYSIISTIKQQEGGTADQVANRLGLGDNYSYTKHLRDGIKFDLGKLQKKLDIELAKWKEQYFEKDYEKFLELKKNIDECMLLLRTLHAPQQAEPYKLPQLEQAKQLELPLAG